MAEPEKRRDEEVLNLESVTLDELGRTLVCEEEAAEDPVSGAAVPVPLVSHRCDSSHRELLRNHFPAE